MPGIPRVDSIKILGVTINNRLSVCEHINQTISACGQSLFALKTLRAHGMQDRTLQVIYKSVTLSKLLYAATAWRGFALSQDIQRIEAFVKKSIRFGFYTKCAPTFVDLCCKSDTRCSNQLLVTVTTFSYHSCLLRLLISTRWGNVPTIFSLREPLTFMIETLLWECYMDTSSCCLSRTTTFGLCLFYFISSLWLVFLCYCNTAFCLLNVH